MTASIRKVRIIVLVSNRIEYWSNNSIRFEISNIRTALISTRSLPSVSFKFTTQRPVTGHQKVHSHDQNPSELQDKTSLFVTKTGMEVIFSIEYHRINDTFPDERPTLQFSVSSRKSATASWNSKEPKFDPGFKKRTKLYRKIWDLANKSSERLS